MLVSLATVIVPSGSGRQACDLANSSCATKRMEGRVSGMARVHANAKVITATTSSAGWAVGGGSLGSSMSFRRVSAESSEASDSELDESELRSLAVPKSESRGSNSDSSRMLFTDTSRCTIGGEQSWCRYIESFLEQKPKSLTMFLCLTSVSVLISFSKLARFVSGMSLLSVVLSFLTATIWPVERPALYTVPNPPLPMQNFSLKPSVAFTISPNVNFPSLSHIRDSDASYFLLILISSSSFFFLLRRTRNPAATAKRIMPSTGTRTAISTFLFLFPESDLSAWLHEVKPCAFPQRPGFPTKASALAPWNFPPVGIGPDNVLFRFSSVMSFPKFDGIVPESSLKLSNFSHFPSSSGTVPFRLFDDKSRFWRFPNSEGISPVSSFSSKVPWDIACEGISEHRKSLQTTETRKGVGQLST
nr:hypothetical protein CDL12_23042 [Ipomoea batatas]